MITKKDWNNALDSWIADERERLGGPPTPDEVVAYLSGELSGEAAKRVRALLVYYPELTPLLDEKIQPAPHKKREWIAASAVVATLAVGVLLFRRDSAEPFVPTSHHEFNALRARSPETTYELPAGEPQYLITIVPSAPPEGEHSIEILSGTKVRWSAKRVRAIDDTFVVSIPGDFLKPGLYTLRIRSDRGSIDSYTFRIATPMYQKPPLP